MGRFSGQQAIDAGGCQAGGRGGKWGEVKGVRGGLDVKKSVCDAVGTACVCKCMQVESSRDEPTNWSAIWQTKGKPISNAEQSVADIIARAESKVAGSIVPGMPPSGAPPPPPKPAGGAGSMGMPPPPGMPPGFPPPPSMPPGQLDAQEEAKRAKAEEQLMPEAQWTAQHPNPISVKVITPQEEENAKFNFNGQTVLLKALAPSTMVKDLKASLTQHLGGLPGNKIKLTSVKYGVLKDTVTVAFYNFVDGENVMVTTK